jgi:dipeptidyl-peptidase-3
VAINPTLHAEVLQRYRRLDLAPYKGFINPRYTPCRDESGQIISIHVDYDESYAEQMLRYSRDYATL